MVSRSQSTQNEGNDLMEWPAEFKDFVELLSNNTIKHLNADLLHPLMGIASESGEILDIYKNHMFYGEELDTVELLMELGDLYHFLQRAVNALHVSLDDIESINRAKLMSRYPQGYSNYKATRINRDRKAEYEAAKKIIQEARNV